MQLDWSDINKASKLCVGRPIVYKAKEVSGINDEWLVREVCPGIAATFDDGDGIAAILGRTLLWTCFEESIVDQVATLS